MKTATMPKSRSLISAAELDMKFIETLPPTREAGQAIVSRIYEDFRMLGEAVLAAKATPIRKDDHHRQMIQALIELKVNTKIPLALLHNLRVQRHKVNYDGYIPTENDIREVIRIKKALWPALLSHIKKEVK